MKSIIIKLDADEAKFVKKVTSHGKYRHLLDAKSVYMNEIMIALASIS